MKVYDPKAMHNAARMFPTLHYVDSVTAAAQNADIVLHLTEWAEFAALDPVEMGTLVKQQVVIDGRNTLDAPRWRAAGWTYRGLGRP